MTQSIHCRRGQFFRLRPRDERLRSGCHLEIKERLDAQDVGHRNSEQAPAEQTRECGRLARAQFVAAPQKNLVASDAQNVRHEDIRIGLGLGNSAAP